MSILKARHGDNTMEEMWDGKDIFREGVWCMKDMGTEKYEALGDASQAASPWAYNVVYAKDIIYFIVVIISLFIIKRLAFHLVDQGSTKSTDRSNKGKKLLYKLSAFSRYFSYRRLPRLVCEIFQLPSSFGNFVVILVGVLYILCYCFIPKPWYRACAGFGSPQLATRSGLQSTALVPIIFILSGKTNIISQLTGISYEKVNVYHRWVSVMCCLLGWVHTIAFYYQSVYEGGYARLRYDMKTNSLFVNGIPPMLFLTILTVFSHSYIRALWYELWLDIHWICALGFFISLFIHIDLLLESWKYMTAALVFWSAQMVWRGVSKNFFRLNKGFMRSSPCTMKRLASTEKNHYFEINIENVCDFTWSPGQHVFLRIPGLRFLENHPFSIMSYFEPMENSSMKFIVKTGGWKGITSLIYESLPDQGFKETTVFVDGPYGGSERQISSFNNIFLISSGTGITAILPFLMEYVDKFDDKKSILKSLRLDWVIRDSENIDWILPELQKTILKAANLLANGAIEIVIYISNEIGISNTDSLDELLKSKSSLSLDNPDKSIQDTSASVSQYISVQNCKPDFPSIIENDISKKLSYKNMFVVSGSDSMKSSVSTSVANLQKLVLSSSSKVDEIYLHSETFGW